MKFKRHVYLEKGGINMVPLINCVFLLMIFFLLTSNFMFQPGIKINLPKAVTSEVVQGNTIVITMTSDNRYYLDEAPITMAELKNKLERVSGSKPILIKADRDVALGKVASLWDFCRDVGAKQINIATNQEVK